MKRKLIPLFLLMLLLVLTATPMYVLAEGTGATIPGTQIDLTPVLQALIGLLATVITVKVVPWIKARTTAQQQATLGAVVKMLVYAAEQIYGARGGKEKLQYVQEELLKRGYVVDMAEIEAAVRGMNTDNTILNFDVPITIEETVTETE